jgi:histidinol dehydrogenase
VVIAPLTAAPPWSDLIAPEHVEFAVEATRAAGRPGAARRAHLPGPHAPEAIGDYVAGSNHVLPTSRAARFSSGCRSSTS